MDLRKDLGERGRKIVKIQLRLRSNDFGHKPVIFLDGRANVKAGQSRANTFGVNIRIGEPILSGMKHE